MDPVSPSPSLPPPPPWHPHYYLPKNAQSILDIGCNVGAALQYAYNLGVPKLFGIEINPLAAEEAKKNLAHVKECKIIHESADALPIDSSSIDVALCTEVLEHIPENLRPGVIRETHRILKNNGTWIITVPAKGLFSFLDPANFRLLFPTLFRILEKLVGGRGREAGYENQKHGIVWHHHFTLSELKKTLEPYFVIKTVRFRGCLLAPICNWLQFPFYRAQAHNSRILKMINTVESWEMARQFSEFFGYNVLIVCKKSNDTPPSNARF